MKRMFITTALAASLATGAFAQSGTHVDTVREYLPDADLSQLSEQEFDALVGVALSSDSRSEKVAAMKSLVNTDDGVAVTVSSGQLSELQAYAPDIDFTEMSAQQIAHASGIINSAETRSDAIAQLRSFAENPDVMMAPPLSSDEMATIETMAPELDVMSLSEEEILRVQSAIATGDDNRIRRVLDALVAG